MRAYCIQKNIHCIKATVIKANISAEIQKRDHSTWMGTTGKTFLKNVLGVRIRCTGVWGRAVKGKQQHVEWLV